MAWVPGEDVEGQEEGEGSTGFVAAKAAAVDFKPTETVTGSVCGYSFVIRVSDVLAEISALSAEQSEWKYSRLFDDQSFHESGFPPATTLKQVVDTLRSALQCHESLRSEMRDAKDALIWTMHHSFHFFHFTYTLRLPRVHLDECDSLRLENDKLKAALKRKDARIEELTQTVEDLNAVAVTKDLHITNLVESVDELKATMTIKDDRITALELALSEFTECPKKPTMEPKPTAKASAVSIPPFLPAALRSKLKSAASRSGESEEKKMEMGPCKFAFELSLDCPWAYKRPGDFALRGVQKTATCLDAPAQIGILPSLKRGAIHSLRFKVNSCDGAFTVGFTDDLCAELLYTGCVFHRDGYVWVNGEEKSGWKPSRRCRKGDVWSLTLTLGKSARKGTVSFSATNSSEPYECEWPWISLTRGVHCVFRALSVGDSITIL